MRAVQTSIRSWKKRISDLETKRLHPESFKIEDEVDLDSLRERLASYIPYWDSLLQIALMSDIEEIKA